MRDYSEYKTKYRNHSLVLASVSRSLHIGRNGLAEALGESISLLAGAIVGGVGVSRLNKLLLCLDDHYGGVLQRPDPP
jgi:hypothetical protein